MRTNLTIPTLAGLAIGGLTLIGGCGGDESSPQPTTSSSPTASEQQVEDDSAAETPGTSEPAEPERAPAFAPVQLGAAPSGSSTSATDDGSEAGGDTGIQSVIDQLKPIQVVLGKWRGTTRKEYDGFKAVDEHEWVWDLQSNATQPALVMTSDKSPYLRSARLTWNTDAGVLELTGIDPDGEQRAFTGEFTQPVEDVVGDDEKLHRTFKLQFTQTAPADAAEHWQFTYNQQENNRYLLEVAKKRGSSSFRRFDTVSTQREGTSFALSDTDYGEKTCIISEGLGTTAVSYKGRTYWVCCSGCKAAFEEDPEKWIAIAAERKAEKK